MCQPTPEISITKHLRTKKVTNKEKNSKRYIPTTPIGMWEQKDNPAIHTYSRASCARAALPMPVVCVTLGNQFASVLHRRTHTV